MRTAGILALFVVLCATGAEAQRRRAPAPRKPTPAALKKEPALVKCPEALGTGIRTNAEFCFVLAGREPAQGVLVTIPPHTGPATLRFDLHNRHSYSEEQMRGGRGFARYTAVIGALTMTGDLLGRAAVESEVRTEADLYDRISGGAGPGGAKAVAPSGRESISIAVPQAVTAVSLLGELLDATTAAGREIATPGRPVAIVSNIQVEYKPAPVKKPRK
jgi:hypothetical protein